MKGFWTILNNFKLVKNTLLDNDKIEINQIHKTYNMKGDAH